MRRLIRAVAALPFRMLPPALRRRAVQAGLTAAAAREPRAALRELLQIETDLHGLIDETAMLYGSGVHVKHRLMRYHDFFVDRVRNGERVLDVGCGYGAVAHSMAERAGAEVVGIDLESSNVASARRMFPHPRLTFVTGQAPRDLPEGTFDVVVASNVLEHIEDRRGFLREVQERTQPSRWLIRVPMIDRDWRVPLRQELGLFHFCDPTHFVEYTTASFAAEMKEAGFRVAEQQVNWGELWAEVRCA
jgi:2-polyprenyl-3-methyl-5-hydroxy-6-metoxy-1,4-benzoquinol methylase